MRALAGALLAASLALPAFGQPAAARLEALAHEALEGEHDLYPAFETYRVGAGPRQGKMEDWYSAAHRERERAFRRDILARARAIPVAGLDETQAITRALLVEDSQRELARLDIPFLEHAILTQTAYGLAPQTIFLVSLQPLRDEADYEAWMSRLARFPSLLSSARTVLQRGLATGVVTPAVLVRAAIRQWEALAPEDPVTSTLWNPIGKFPASLDDKARARIEKKYRALLEAEVLPAMRAFTAFARDTYLPRARASDGLGAVPGGDRMYRVLARQHTTTELTPDEIHELGLAEVRRIQTQLLIVAQRSGFKGEMRDLGSWLESRTENYPFATPDDVLRHLREMHETRIMPHVHKLFRRVPKAALEIRLVEPELAATASASYSRPPADGSRPGVFRIPVLDARKTALHRMRSLLAHEAVPGHHFEIALADELDVPAFRRYYRTVAFGEGWALYAESLGHAIDLYDEPLSLMGRYLGELFRAARLVVDTGLHAKGWTRERAIRYMMEEGGSAEQQATSEVQRYMANPGQALGYKVGELTITDLRMQAERRLGERFDVKEFHEVLLGQGHMPLSMLRTRIGAWIEARAP